MQYTLQKLIDLGLPASRVWEENILGEMQTQAEFERPLTEAELIIFLSVTDSDKAEIKKDYLNALETLDQIATATTFTNAQVIAAIKFIAKTLKLLIKLIVRQY